jgi:hypothetical protein
VYADAAEAKLDAFLAAGVTYLVDLTEEGEHDLRPYAELLRTRAAQRGIQASHVSPWVEHGPPSAWTLSSASATELRVMGTPYNLCVSHRRASEQGATFLGLVDVPARLLAALLLRGVLASILLCPRRS